METQIEKAKQQHQVGEIKIGNDGIKRVWTQLADGSYDWRRVKKDKGSKEPSAKQPEKKESASKSSQKPVSSSKQQSSNNNDEPENYGRPKPKVVYKNGPDKDAYFYVPEKWTYKSGREAPSRDTMRALLKKKTDAEIIEMVNDEKRNENVRMLAWEEAAARGIPENKLSTKGSLEKAWRTIKKLKDWNAGYNPEENEEDDERTYNMKNLQGMDAQAFYDAHFADGNTGWANPDNPIITKEFKLEEASERRRYDAFVDFVKRKDPNYIPPKGQMQQLNGLYAYMLDETFKHPENHSPMLISAGAPGAGKTWGFLAVADDLGLQMFDDKKHTKGGSGYKVYLAKEEIEDPQDFNKLLSEHNGKVILFDDNDKLLTTKKGELLKMMKRILDTNPKMRKFHNTLTGKEDTFTGTLVFTTNKTIKKLSEDPDKLAVLSRGIVSDVQFTMNEILDVMRDRYKTLGKPMSSVTPQEEEGIREELFEAIEMMTDKLDPQTFTVRTFEKVLAQIDKQLSTNKRIGVSSNGNALYGKKMDWRKMLPSMIQLAKAQENDIEKALPKEWLTKDMSRFEQFDDDVKEFMAEKYKKDPKKFISMYGKELANLVSKKADKNVEKGIVVDFGGMSLEEAENILFK